MKKLKLLVVVFILGAMLAGTIHLVEQFSKDSKMFLEGSSAVPSTMIHGDY